MARDYRHTHRPKQGFQRKSQLQASSAEEATAFKQVWLLGGALGLALVGGYFIVSHFLHHGVQSSRAVTTPQMESGAPQTHVTEHQQALTVKALPSSKPVKAASDDAKPSDDRVRYTFYQGLAKTEVIVDAEPLPVKLPQPYYIQAGSFGKKEVALKEQARLKRYGFDTQLSAQKGQKRIYYRLRLGPFSDRLEMNKVRNQLRDVGVDTLLIKAPKPKVTELASQTEKGKASVEGAGN